MKQDHDETEEGLAPDAAAFLDSVRGLDEPTAGDRHRVRRRVLGAVAATGAASAAGGTATAAAATAGGTTAGAAVGGTLTAKVWIGIAVGLGVAGVAGGVATMSPEPEERAQVAPVSPDSDSALGSRNSESESASESGSESESESGSESGSASEPNAVPSQGVPLTDAPTPTVAQPAPARRPTAPTPETTEPPSAESAETLAEELALIRRAHATANDGNHTEALRILDDHARCFPSGALATERQGARASTLCQAGRLGEGRAAAERFLAAHPSSPLRGRVTRACAE